MSSCRERISSGTDGLDAILRGGFRRGQTAIVRGGPGTGKTLLASQFLAGAEGDALYVGFEERAVDVRRNAESAGIDVSDVEMIDLSADPERFFEEESYDLLPPEELEGEDLLARIAKGIEEHDPDRLVIDPLSELRSLLPDEFQFRRNISSLIHELKERETTTLCTAQSGEGLETADIEFLGDATLVLRREGRTRTLEVTKFRGSDSAPGRHTLRIESADGLRVYPKLVPEDHYRTRERERIGTGVDELDALLGGGIERGSTTVISGASGVGKTTTGTHILQRAAERDERAAIYLFEESEADFRYRSTQLGIAVDELVDAGWLEIHEIEPLTRSVDEFAAEIREAVEDRGVNVVMIDGIDGYRMAIRGERTDAELTRELHAISRYLKRMGVTNVIVEEVSSLGGEFEITDEDISYLADNILFLRYLERPGEIRKVAGVLKKRLGDFERSLRELEIRGDGLWVGEPLTGLHGVLTGAPERVSE